MVLTFAALPSQANDVDDILGLDDNFPQLEEGQGFMLTGAIGIETYAARVLWNSNVSRNAGIRGTAHQALESIGLSGDSLKAVEVAAMEALDDNALRRLGRQVGELELNLVKAGITETEAARVAFAIRASSGAQSETKATEVLRAALRQSEANRGLRTRLAAEGKALDRPLFNLVQNMSAGELLRDAQTGKLVMNLRKIGIEAEAAESAQRLVISRAGAIRFVGIQRLLGVVMFADVALKTYTLFQGHNPGILPFQTLYIVGRRPLRRGLDAIDQNLMEW